MKLPFGVRRVFTPNGGTEIVDLDALEDGNTYLCASFEKFKPANYGKPVDNRPEWGLVGGTLLSKFMKSKLNFCFCNFKLSPLTPPPG